MTLTRRTYRCPGASSGPCECRRTRARRRRLRGSRRGTTRTRLVPPQSSTQATAFERARSRPRGTLANYTPEAYRCRGRRFRRRRKSVDRLARHAQADAAGRANALADNLRDESAARPAASLSVRAAARVDARHPAECRVAPDQPRHRRAAPCNAGADHRRVDCRPTLWE